MLGLLYFLFIGIGIAIYSIFNINKNNECKKKYKSKDGLTYTDLKGHSRLLSNDNLVFYTHNKQGDYILEDISGNVYKNFSKEKRLKDFNTLKETALKTNSSTYCIDDNNHRKDWYCKGKRFIDIKTGEVYVIRYINYKYYYINISNGMLIRKTDWQEKKDRSLQNVNLDKDIDIDNFNKHQMNIQDLSLLFRDYDYNFLCDIYK